MTGEFLGQILEKYTNIKFQKNPFCGSRVVPCGQIVGPIDMTKLIVTLCNLANAPKNQIHGFWK